MDGSNGSMTVASEPSLASVLRRQLVELMAIGLPALGQCHYNNVVWGKQSRLSWLP